jgi:glutaminyl-tRNA synthetase
LDLVEQKVVTGWDDPRLPTLAGLRRRGYTPEAIRAFAEAIGVAKRDSTISSALLEYCLREDLNRRARRVMAVLRPLKVVIENYPEGRVEWFDAENNPEESAAGTRKLPFSREIWIERDDFREDPPKKFFRLSPGREIRLKFAYYITCTGVIKDPASGEATELRCTYDPASHGGSTTDGRKVLGTSHWVSAAHCLTAEVRLYDRLFLDEDPAAALASKRYADVLNPASLEVLTGCQVEPALAETTPDEPLQFLRQGYFCRDRVDGRGERLVFNRTATLRDTWARIEKAGAPGASPL